MIKIGTVNGDVIEAGGVKNVTNNYYGSELAEEPSEDLRLEAEAEVPEVLAESELWKKVQDAGLVDEGGQPAISRTEAAILANEIAERLGIAHKWKLFETLWHRNNMRSDYNTALEQRKSLLFQEKLKKILR